MYRRAINIANHLVAAKGYSKVQAKIETIHQMTMRGCSLHDIQMFEKLFSVK